MKRILILAAMAAMASPVAMATDSSVFTSLGNYATYDAWKAAQEASVSRSASSSAAEVVPGGYTTAKSSVISFLEARFRTWCESAGIDFNSFKATGLVIIFR